MEVAPCALRSRESGAGDPAQGGRAQLERAHHLLHVRRDVTDSHAAQFECVQQRARAAEVSGSQERAQLEDGRCSSAGVGSKRLLSKRPPSRTHACT